MPVMSGSSKGNDMTVDSANARIYGSGLDSIHLAPIETALPTTIDGALDPAFEDVGWIHSDGINEALTGSVTKIRGHQGGNVVRTLITESGITIGFHALESKGQTNGLRYDEKDVVVSGGVRKVTRGPGQKISPRSAVIELYDADNVTIKLRWVIPRFEISPDGERTYANSDIAGFPFLGDIVGESEHYEGPVSQTAPKWTVGITGSPTGGTYRVAVNGFSTAALAYNAPTADVAEAINALAGVTGIAGVTASGTISAVVLTFPSAVVLTANGTSLSGGTTPAATVTITV